MRLKYVSWLALTPLLAAGLLGCAEEKKAPVVMAPPPVVVPRPRPQLQPQIPAPVCAKPAEETALAVTALRMQLSVIDITCGARDQFNAFTVKFRNDIGAQNKTLGGFFARAYGRRGQAQQDEYETNQINQMSQQGQYYGADFCKIGTPMFDQVLALKNGAELAEYANAQRFDQVLAMTECAAAPAPAPKPAAKTEAKPAPKPAAKP